MKKEIRDNINLRLPDLHPLCVKSTAIEVYLKLSNNKGCQMTFNYKLFCHEYETAMQINCRYDKIRFNSEYNPGMAVTSNSILNYNKNF